MYRFTNIKYLNDVKNNSVDMNTKKLYKINQMELIVRSLYNY